MLLKDKVALVTGGTRGIGKAIAKKFVEEGAHVALIGMQPERGAQAVEELSALTDKKVRFYALNIAERESVTQTISKISEEMGTIGILVNNAGVTRDQLLMKMDIEDWDEVIKTNLNSIFYTCQSVIRSMIKARYGKIINISSVVGLMGNPGQTNYAAAKAGMIGFTKALAKEVATRGINVNCIAPGFIETDMTHKLNEEQKKAIITQIPMQKLGRVEYIADAALFLASNLSDYITGQTLTVDGGMVM
jgi:3-oxoacyl-[acyl-carrier protein] reductase